MRTPSLCLYATPGGERVLIKELELQPAAKGANVTLWITPRSDFYRDRQDLPNGITTTSLAALFEKALMEPISPTRRTIAAAGCRQGGWRIRGD
jgi:hypothetical protein